MFKITREDIEALKINLPYVAIIALSFGVHILFARLTTLQTAYSDLQQKRVEEHAEQARFWREAWEATDAAYMKLLQHENSKVDIDNTRSTDAPDRHESRAQHRQRPDLPRSR